MNCANHPDRERVAFCQNCGKPICQECTRTVGSAVFCEPCLMARLAGAGAPAAGSSAYVGSDPNASYPAGAVPPPPLAGEPNPGLAALLGIIPGVGAMYNGQYAKGVVHLVVFAVLVSLSSENGIFGLFIAGWVCYMIIEAYHTARARRDGTPLPNPFGLNELGERLGFGKAWPTGTASQPFTPPADSTATPPAGTYPPYTAPPAASWSNTPENPAWNWGNHVPPPQPGSPYAAPFAPVNPVDPNAAYPAAYPPAYPRNRFPAGAIWLIVLGAIFLLGNSHVFHIFPMHWFLPFLLIGFGVWLFVRRMTEFGAPLADDGTAHYRYRVVHAMHGSVWIILVGVLFLLDSFHILSWAHSWPLFIIVAGLMAIFRSMAYSTPLAPYPPHPNAPPPATSVVPPSTHDQEGS